MKPHSDCPWGTNHRLTAKWWHTQQVPSARELFHTVRCSFSRRTCHHGQEAWELLHKNWAKYYVLALLFGSSSSIIYIKRCFQEAARHLSAQHTAQQQMAWMLWHKVRLCSFFYCINIFLNDNRGIYLPVSIEHQIIKASNTQDSHFVKDLSQVSIR